MTRKNTERILRLIPVLIFGTGIFFSACENDIDTIQRVTYDPGAPDRIERNMNLLYNDSGYAQVRIHATLAETYNAPQHITKLRNGLQVDFFTDDGKIVSTLTALNGEINFNTDMVVVRDSVVLHNYAKKQRLETEELNWNQKDSTIYTDKYVRIKTEGKGITGQGQGVRTTSSFEKYTILKPVGTFDLDED